MDGIGYRMEFDLVDFLVWEGPTGRGGVVGFNGMS